MNNNYTSTNKSNLTTPNKYDSKYLTYDTSANKINSNYDENINKKYLNINNNNN